jgi:hypothetical protein
MRSPQVKSCHGTVTQWLHGAIDFLTACAVFAVNDHFYDTFPKRYTARIQPLVYGALYMSKVPGATRVENSYVYALLI